MRRVLFTLAFSAVAALPAFTWGDCLLDRCHQGPRIGHARGPAAKRADDRLVTCPAPPPLSRSFERVEARGLKFTGVGSCAAAACHGGGEERGKKGSEYSTWAAIDPHAKAFRALGKPESRRMHEIMSEAFPALARYRSASTNPLCLKCHGMGAATDAHFQSDGAGCERCHGPAEKWRTTHYQYNFDRQRTPGFVDMRCDLAARTFACMKCHVGDASQEVDHVLIAAGHPRLRFEYGAYYANYPRHWEDLGEKRRDPTFEAFTWGLGQLVTARSALELLIARADDPEKEPNWPEFAEYDCTACHHDLNRISSRQDRSAREADAGVLPKRKRAGQLPWGTWYYPLLPTLRHHLAGAPAGLAENLEALDQLMRLRYPPRKEVVAQARKLIVQLDPWISSQVHAEARLAGKPSFTPAQVRKLMHDLAGRRDLVEQGWDGASQVYLGLAAMNHATADADDRFAEEKPYRDPLAAIRVGLKHSFEPGGRTLYDTPNDYPLRIRSILKGLDAFRRKD